MGSKFSFRFNYVYFALFLGLLTLMTTSSILLKENLAQSRLFFWFYAFGQATFEVLAWMLLGGLLLRYVGRKTFLFFMGLTFVILVLHVLDFLMDRILDLSLLDTIGFVLDEDLTNFLYLLDASGIPLWAWGLAFAAVIALPFLGIAIYKATDWLSEKKPLLCRAELFSQVFLCVPAALFFWDFTASRIIQPDAYTEFSKSLPWKGTFLQPETVHLATPRLAPLPTAETVESEVAQFGPPLAMKPNIFLFIAESLRSDFLSETVAPHLSRFREESLRGALSLSNANGSHISWFSLFHSQFPFAWATTKRERQGSPALSLFRQLGYKVRLYTSAQLNYYGMEELLFGAGGSLVDVSQTFHHAPPKHACDSDREALDALKRDLATDVSLQSGNLFIVFWDATHFDYSWPAHEHSKFIPFAKELAYFRAFYSRGKIEAIRNRYRNAVHYIDSLFGEFLSVAPPDSIIAFAGDHGEEFFDHGHLFHGSHLTQEQMSVPIYLKIDGKAREVPLLTQMDVMPTLLDAVSGRTSPLLQGESALRPRAWPFAVTARFNASRSPYEFCLHNGAHKMIAQFEEKTKIYESRGVRILSLRQGNDQRLEEGEVDTAAWVEREFGPAMKRLFTAE